VRVRTAGKFGREGEGTGNIIIKIAALAAIFIIYLIETLIKQNSGLSRYFMMGKISLIETLIKQNSGLSRYFTIYLIETLYGF
jgi:hypothetical protein